MVGNERRMQPKRKMTRHGSEATTSIRIRHVHEELRAHKSYQTDLRQAQTYMNDIGVHLAAFRPRTGPNGPSPRSADHVVAAHRPHRLSVTCGKVWLVPNGGLASFLGEMRVVPSYKYKGRGSK